MHIIYTGSFRFPEGDAAAARVLNNSKILRDLGHQVTFISWGGNTNELDKSKDGNYYFQGFRYIIAHDIDIKQSNFVKKIHNYFFNGINSLRLIKHKIKNIDVIIGYNPSMFFTFKMLRFCQDHNIPFVSDITEWYDPNELPGGKYAPPSWINELNMCFIQKKVKNKIVISSFLDEYFNSSKNIILPPLVDCSEAKWINTESIIQPFEGIRIIYAGNPSGKDLLETMFDAVLACLKRGLNLQFLVLGVFKQDILHYNKYNEILATNNIILYGKVPQGEIPRYYKASDFSLIIREPTKKNMAGFPTKLVESMMAGCPVLLNYTSDIDKYIHNGYNGYILANSSSDELQKIFSIIVTLSRTKIDLLKANALKCALKNFNYSNYVTQAENFIAKLK